MLAEIWIVGFVLAFLKVFDDWEKILTYKSPGSRQWQFDLAAAMIIATCWPWILWQYRDDFKK